MRTLRYRMGAAAVAAWLGAAPAALAVEPTPTALFDSSQADVVRTLAANRRKFGADAALLQTAFVANCIQAGSLLEISVAISGYEEHEGRKFLAFAVDTGVVYNDRDVPAHAQLGRLWSQIVERTLRQLDSLTVRAEGLALHLTYAHQAYADDAERYTHLRDTPPAAEAVAFYLLANDVREWLAGRLTGQQLADRAPAWQGATAHPFEVEPPPGAAKAGSNGGPH